MKKSPGAEKRDTARSQAQAKQRPKERRHTGHAGSPASMAIAAALNDAQDGKPTALSEDERAHQKRLYAHPIYALLRRVARDNYTPKKDEIEALNLPTKYKSELAYAIRHVSRWRDEPTEVEERKNVRGTKTIIAGYRSSASIAHEKAHELAHSLIESLPQDHETRVEVKARHAAEDAQAARQSDDSEAIAERVWGKTHNA